MASIEIIQRVFAHPNADRLEIACVSGFESVVPKDKYKAGDKILFIVPDQVLPNDLWATDYKKYAPNRVRAIKIRDYYSQGIIVPLDQLPCVNLDTLQSSPPTDFDEVKENTSAREAKEIIWSDVAEGTQVSQWLEIKHFDSIANSDGLSKVLPFLIPKTDEERYEKIQKLIPYDEICDVQLKIDGQSCSYYYYLPQKQFGVLSRNLEIKVDLEDEKSVANCSYSRHIKTLNIRQKLQEYCEKHQVSLCIRGESYGTKIQSFAINPHCKLQPSWAMFSVFNITSGRYENRGDSHYFKTVALECGFPVAPLIEENVPITTLLLEKYSTLMNKLIGGESFEGVVIKYAKGSFKVINKYYDSKKD